MPCTVKCNPAFTATPAMSSGKRSAYLFCGTSMGTCSGMKLNAALKISIKAESFPSTRSRNSQLWCAKHLENRALGSGLARYPKHPPLHTPSVGFPSGGKIPQLCLSNGARSNRSGSSPGHGFQATHSRGPSSTLTRPQRGKSFFTLVQPASVRVAHPDGIEPSTAGLEDRCSIH